MEGFIKETLQDNRVHSAFMLHAVNTVPSNTVYGCDQLQKYSQREGQGKLSGNFTIKWKIREIWIPNSM